MALGVRGVLVGCWTAPDGDTGTTVVLPPPGTIGGAALRGGAPGSRETDALSPTGSVEACHAVVLTGGSAFGLATADGVMAWCEERGLGYELPTVTVPIVGAAVCFDIRRRGQRRPGRSAGWAACEAAVEDDPPQGSIGVGAGCTAGKLAGRDWATKGGQGWSVMRSGELTVGALMAVNPVGEVVDEDGTVLAGTLAPPDAPRYPHATMEQIRIWGEARAAAQPAGDGDAEAAPPGDGDAEAAPPGDGDAEAAPPGDEVGVDGHAAAGERARSPDVVPMTNTVIGCVVTNATMKKHAICRAADLAHTGIARAVVPAHTSADGDLLFLLATGQGPPAPVDLVADLAARAVAEAIRSAVVHATGIPGAPADPRARRRAPRRP